MAKKHRIKEIIADSIAQELEIEVGDYLLAVDDREIEDIFDFQFMVHSEELVLLIEKANGEQWELEIEKDYDEDIGMEFEQGLMDEYKSCKNSCVFCFIHQMPPGMRETLYFQDDDARLSFLQGNYVTLTNMKEEDIQRIIRYNLGPINVSIHTMNPVLRCKMLRNKTAGEDLKKMDSLYEGAIEMNGQIVLCPGYNDKEELEFSIQEMSKYLPYLQSVSVVPIGLTKFREGLAPMRPFTKEEAVETLAIIHKWQDKLYKDHGTHFIHAGDEWYLLADMEIPKEERYDGYLQLENGVGMLRLLYNEFQEALDKESGDHRSGHITLVTGTLMAPVMRELTEKIMVKFPNLNIQVKAIVNDFFGHTITVSGLITGGDLLNQLKTIHLGDKVLLPGNLLRSGEEVFLDDITLDEVRDTLQVPLDIVKSSGQDILDSCISRI